MHRSADAMIVAVQPEAKQGLPILEFETQSAWRTWLGDNHQASAGGWLKFAKKSSPRPTVSYAAAVEVALCYGWIDGQAAAYDEFFWLQRFTRRGPRSKWSQINRGKAERLLAQGKLEPAGLAAIEAAKADGRWDAAYAPQSRATVPEDLQLALDQHHDARVFFETLTGANRYAFLYRLHQVKRPENRVKRIAQYVDMLREHKTFHPQVRR